MQLVRDCLIFAGRLVSSLRRRGHFRCTGKPMQQRVSHPSGQILPDFRRVFYAAAGNADVSDFSNARKLTQKNRRWPQSAAIKRRQTANSNGSSPSLFKTPLLDDVSACCRSFCQTARRLEDQIECSVQIRVFDSQRRQQLQNFTRRAAGFNNHASLK